MNKGRPPLMQKWTNGSNKAGKLTKQFDKKPHHFLDIFVQGGVQMVCEQSTNPWNAFMSKKAGEVNGKSY